MRLPSSPVARLSLIAALALAAPAAPPGFGRWTPAQLRAAARRLAHHLDRSRAASVTLARYGNHWTMLAYREASGGAEMHAAASDLFVVERGSATLVVGGRILHPRTVSPGETRGPAIQGGRRVRLQPGDIVHIPPNTPHQLLLAPGVHFTYFVVKVRTK